MLPTADTRQLYLVASLLWALVLGPIAGLAVIGFGAGLAWLYIFGDNSWPPATQWVVGLLGICAGLLTVVAVIRIGYHKYRYLQSSPHQNPIAERKQAITLLIVPLLLILLAAFALWIEARNYRQAMNAATIREATFADLVGVNKKIVAVTIASGPDGTTQAVVRLSGEREGAYYLSWRIIPSSSTASVINGDRTLQLRRGDKEVPLTFTMNDLQRQYQAVVLNGRGGVLVDEPFRLEVSFGPVLTRQESLNLPPGEQRRLESTASPLRTEGSVPFPVHFTIP